MLKLRPSDNYLLDGLNHLSIFVLKAALAVTEGPTHRPETQPNALWALVMSRTRSIEISI